MAIDTSGKWWKGENFEDLKEYIKVLTAEGYPADEVKQCLCTCGNSTFQLRADRDEGCAQRQCDACGQTTFLCDSEAYWEDSEPQLVRCPCKHTVLELGVGFALREGGPDVRWVVIGQRCTRCGTLACYVDWGIDYSPSEHLLSMV